MGADAADAPPAAEAGPAADVVVDTTGQPEGFALALALARREVHLKSTHGRASGGLAHATELVVDEITLARLPGDERAAARAVARCGIGAGGARPLVAWLAAAAPPDGIATTCEVLRGDRAEALLETVTSRRDRLPRADAVVVDRVDRLDEVIRPVAGREIALVRPRGTIFLHGGTPIDPAGSPLADAIVGRGLRVSTSRCGDFRTALTLLDRDAALREALAGVVTHHLPATRLADAMRLARSPEAVKVVVEHARPVG